MKHYLITAILGFFMLCSQAFATSLLPTQNVNIDNDTRASAISAASALSSSQANSLSNAVQDNRTSTDVRTGATTVTNGVNQGNSLNVLYQANPSNMRIETVPDVMAMNVYPTAPCMGSSSVGGSGVGFGFSVGTSWEAKECMIGETARGFEQAGYKADAMAVRCQGVYAAVAPSCKALTVQVAK